MRLDINYKKKAVRNTKTWRLNNKFLCNQQVTEEIKREIKNFWKQMTMKTWQLKTMRCSKSSSKRELSSVQSLSHVRLLATQGKQHARPPCPSPIHGVYPNSCPLSWWCHPGISSSVIPFSFHLRTLLASGSFPMSHRFASGGKSTGVSGSTSVLPVNIQDWFPLGWTGWISLQSKGLSRVFSNMTVQKHQFFGAQLSL